MAYPVPEKVLKTPQTIARLKNLITISVTWGGYDAAVSGIVPSTLPQLTQVGALQKVEVKTMRGATARRELRVDQNNMSGRIIEMVPGLVEYEVNFDYVWLYSASFLEACGFAGHNLEYQTKPLIFQLDLPVPDGSGLTAKSLVLYDCWLKDNPALFDLENKDDLRIIQRVPIACGGVEEY